MWMPALLVLSLTSAASAWRCPGLSARPAAECACDMPHTLRCAGDHTALQTPLTPGSAGGALFAKGAPWPTPTKRVASAPPDEIFTSKSRLIRWIIGRHLREQRIKNKSNSVSLLDCALRGVSALSAASVAELAGVGLHGLVISSGDIRRIQQAAFSSISATLMALGLPNNQLPSVPTEALANLPELERLDLSNNKIHTLDPNSFKGIQNITYLDLSDNQLTSVSQEAFKPLAKLSVLRLRGNLLKVSELPPLKEAGLLRELDLSSNALEGPLGGGTVPALECLLSLQLSDNTFASIRRGALAGLTNLTYLNLHNNQIDVLEDYAFKHLTNLTHLDLSHNEIVAVSGASLAQLTNLVRLDLSHNFLRSLSAEPFKSLDKLADLLVHDNDISMIDDGALTDHTDLRRFTIEDNPLNCDCLMAGFARWLREAKNLSQSDKSAAVCATPPHLEGALLSRLSKGKLCDDFEFNEQTRNTHVEATDKRADSYDYNSIVVADDVKSKYFDKSLLRDEMVNYVDKQDGLDDDVYDEELDVPSDEELAVSKAKVHLFDAWSDAEEVHLSWRVDPPGARYRCTGMTVAKGEALPKHVACHRAQPQNVVLQGLKIDPLEQYTFCIALEEMDKTDTPVALVLGCAPAQPVRSRATYVTATAPTVASPVVTEVNHIRVSEVRSNVTSDGVLTVMISLLGYSDRYQIPLTRSQRITDSKYSPPVYNCYVVLAILSHGSLVAQKDTPCRQTLEVTMDGLVRGPYEVCAALSKKSEGAAPICVVPQLIEVNSMEVKASLKGLNTALIGISLGLMVLVISLVWFVRRILKKPPDIEQHRCYRQEPVVEESNRANYVMLTATSKV